MVAATYQKAKGGFKGAISAQLLAKKAWLLAPAIVSTQSLFTNQKITLWQKLRIATTIVYAP
jgi:hypothetical protein